MSFINAPTFTDVLGGVAPLNATITATVMRKGVEAIRVDGSGITFPEPVKVMVIGGIIYAADNWTAPIELELLTLPPDCNYEIEVAPPTGLSLVVQVVLPGDAERYDFNELITVDTSGEFPVPGTPLGDLFLAALAELAEAAASASQAAHESAEAAAFAAASTATDVETTASAASSAAQSRDYAEAAEAAAGDSASDAGSAAGAATQSAVAAAASLASLNTSKGQANGVAGLDSGARVPDAQLPVRLGVSQLSNTIGEALTADQPRQNAAFMAKTKAKAQALVSRLAPASTANAFPPVSTATTVTVSNSGAPTLAKRVAVNDPNVNASRGLLAWDASNRRYRTYYPYRVSFTLIGSAFEILWTASGATGSDTFWLWVDGKPMTATAGSSGATTTQGGGYYTKWTFPDSTPRVIDLYVSTNAIYNLYIETSAAIAATATPPRVLAVGDSFWAGANGIVGWNFGAGQLSRLLGLDVGNIAEGGTGFVAPGPAGSSIFGSAAKLAIAAAAQPDVIVFSGSVNDDSYAATVGAAALAAFAAYATACPNTPVIVFGPQPSNSTSTLSANRQAVNAALRTAALASPNVIAYHDMIGNASGVVAAYAAGTTYNPGDLATYLGSVWKWVRPLAGSGIAPGTGSAGGVVWGLATYMYDGTGKVGATTSDGNRDTYLANDGVHPTLDGSIALARRQAAEIRADLLAYALS